MLEKIIGSKFEPGHSVSLHVGLRFPVLRHTPLASELASHFFIRLLDERLRLIEVSSIRNGELQVAGSEMADF